MTAEEGIFAKEVLQIGYVNLYLISCQGYQHFHTQAYHSRLSFSTENIEFLSCLQRKFFPEKLINVIFRNEFFSLSLS